VEAHEAAGPLGLTEAPSSISSQGSQLEDRLCILTALVRELLCAIEQGLGLPIGADDFGPVGILASFRSPEDPEQEQQRGEVHPPIPLC
jgi:hypothetical protein